MSNAPIGATGIEDGMYFMDAEDGYRYFYFNTTAEQVSYWARPLIENYYAYDYEDVSAIPIDVWVKNGTSGSETIVKMIHRDVVSEDDRGHTPDYMNSFLIKKFNITDPSDLNSDSGLPYSFTFNSKVYDSNLGNNGGFQITFVSEDELKPLHEEHKAVRSNGTLGYVYLIYDGAEDGKVLVRVASSQPLDKLLKNVLGGGPENELRQLIFLPLMNILISEETDDLINVAAMLGSSIVASGSADPRSEDGKPDLQIIIHP